jgi:hypothetical protein
VVDGPAGRGERSRDLAGRVYPQDIHGRVRRGSWSRTARRPARSSCRTGAWRNERTSTSATPSPASSTTDSSQFCQCSAPPAPGANVLIPLVSPRSRARSAPVASR